MDTYHTMEPLDNEREFVTSFQTDVVNGGSNTTPPTWWSDESGAEMKQRTFLNPLPDGGDIIGGNYHALVSTAMLSDSKQTFAVIVESSKGCISAQSGNLTIMLHRRTNHSDDQGPTPPNDTSVLQSPMRLLVGPSLDVEALRHEVRYTMAVPLGVAAGLPAWGSATSFDGIDSWRAEYKTTLTFFQRSLPQNVHLLSFAVWENGGPQPQQTQVILRLQHVFEVGVHPVWSLDATVDLTELFTPQVGFEICKESEASLPRARGRGEGEGLREVL